MKRILSFISLFLLLHTTGHAQDFNFGLTFGFNAFQRMELERAIYSPDNSYHTYVEEQEGEGLINDNGGLNSVHIGGTINYTWKRLNFFVEPQFYYQRSFYNPYFSFDIERVLGKRAFRMPMYATLNWFKSVKSPYFLVGLNLIREKNIEFQAPGEGYYLGNEELYNEIFFVGDNHFEDLLYQDGTYFNYMLGVGKKFKRFYGSINFQQELNLTKHEIEGKVWRIELSTTFILFRTEKLRTKHFLYVD